MNNWCKIILSLIFLIGIGLLVFMSVKNKYNDNRIEIGDTNILRKYESEISHDTVFRFIDKLANNHLTPQKIYVQKTDTVFIEKITKYDLPIRLEKSGRNLNVKTVNIFDTIVSEYKFDNLGNDFTLVPVKENIIIKSRNFNFCRPDVSIKLYPQQKLKFNYEIISETGVSYKDKIFIIAGFGYGNEKNKFFMSVSLKLKFL
ncbi:MAG: hypothetical protein PHN88_02180 [Ignavibacteria bacterium]|nr:hypothetical protein [Ignavibacteria bacterium]